MKVQLQLLATEIGTEGIKQNTSRHRKQLVQRPYFSSQTLKLPKTQPIPHSVNPNNYLPSQRSRFPNRTRQTSPPATADQCIPSLLGTDRPRQNLHIRSKLSTPRLGVHLLGSTLENTGKVAATWLRTAGFDSGIQRSWDSRARI